MAFTQVIKTLGSVMESMKSAVDTWLSQNITNPSNPPLDRSLSLSNACAPADMVGDIRDEVVSNIDPFNNQINLFNGKEIVYGGWSGANFTLDATQQKITAVIPCLPDTTYWIVRSGPVTDRFGRVGTTVNYPTAGEPVTQLADMGGALKRSVTTGSTAKYLLFYYTYTALDEFIQITDFQAIELLQNTYPILPDSIYTKKQVNEIINNLPLSNKKCKFSKVGNSISIYIPSKTSNRFIRFVYKLHVDSAINMNQWKVMDINICNPDLSILFNLYAGTANNTEWEGVVRETGTSDYIGGYHGDETNQMISVFVDGSPLDMSADYTLTDCEDVFIVNKSLVNKCNTPSVNLFTRYKVSHWTKDKYTIENRWIVLESVNLDRVYLTMMSLPIANGDYQIATYGRYNDGYIVQPSEGVAINGSCLYNSRYASIVEMWGTDFYARCKGYMTETDPHVVYCDRSQSNIFKGYWWQYFINGGASFSTNDELHGFSEYEFMF